MSEVSLGSVEPIKPTGKIPDPYNVPVTFCNAYLGGGSLANVVNVTLGVFRFTPTFDAKTDNDMIIAARLRLDIDCAVQLRDFLNAQIALLSHPKGDPN